MGVLLALLQMAPPTDTQLRLIRSMGLHAKHTCYEPGCAAL